MFKNRLKKNMLSLVTGASSGIGLEYATQLARDYHTDLLLVSNQEQELQQVATDLAARGIDVTGIDVVFNYDVPDEQEYYIHRIGRTGHAKRHGVAYTLVTTIVPYISYTTGLQQVENGVAAVLACIEPVMATVFGIFFFSEMPDLSGCLGILLVLIALTALNLQPKKQQSEERL